MRWVSFVVLGLPLESFSDRLHSRCKLFFDLRMNSDADTQDLAGIYQLEAAVFVQNADYTFAMMSAASGCDQVALVNLDNLPLASSSANVSNGARDWRWRICSIMGVVLVPQVEPD